MQGHQLELGETERQRQTEMNDTHTCGFNLRNQEMCDMFCACEGVKHAVCVFFWGFVSSVNVFECVFVRVRADIRCRQSPLFPAVRL